VTTRRQRIDCPICGRDVALNPKGTIRLHVDQTGEVGTYYCPASNAMTAAAVRAAELARLADLVTRYPQQARELVTDLVCERCEGKGKSENAGTLPPGYPTHSTCTACSGHGVRPRSKRRSD
jgi:hypothetical protein